MNTRTASTLISLAFFGLLAGCGGSGGGGAAPPAPPPPPPPPPPPVVPMSAAGIWVGEAVTPDPTDISTGFEFPDTNGFTMGTAPFTVDFQGGVTQTIGNSAFYHAGDFSWHISSAGASIVFGVPVESVSLWTRTTTNGDVATIKVLDESGMEISSTAVTDNFVQIVEVQGMGAPLIGSVVITVAAGDEIVIDTFTSSFVSAPSTDLINCLFAPAPRDDFVCSVADLGGNLLASANGTYSVNGNQVTGDGNLYAPPGETLADGSTVALLTISAGTVVEDTSLDVTIISSGLGIAVTSLFDATYDRGANLATVAAVYSMFDIFGVMSSFAIDANGVISGQTTTGCVLSGQVSVIDAAANTYAVNLVADAATCGALAGDYNGLGSSQDDTVMDDAFIFAAFVNGQLMTVGEAIK